MPDSGWFCKLQSGKAPVGAPQRTQAKGEREREGVKEGRGEEGRERGSEGGKIYTVFADVW